MYLKGTRETFPEHGMLCPSKAFSCTMQATVLFLPLNLAIESS